MTARRGRSLAGEPEVALAPRDAVRVEPLQQRHRVLAAGAQGFAERADRDAPVAAARTRSTSARGHEPTAEDQVLAHPRSGPRPCGRLDHVAVEPGRLKLLHGWGRRLLLTADRRQRRSTSAARASKVDAVRGAGERAVPCGPRRRPLGDRRSGRSDQVGVGGAPAARRAGGHGVREPRRAPAPSSSGLIVRGTSRGAPQPSGRADRVGTSAAHQPSPAAASPRHLAPVSCTASCDADRAALVGQERGERRRDPRPRAPQALADVRARSARRRHVQHRAARHGLAPARLPERRSGRRHPDQRTGQPDPHERLAARLERRHPRAPAASRRPPPRPRRP